MICNVLDIYLLLFLFSIKFHQLISNFDLFSLKIFIFRPKNGKKGTHRLGHMIFLSFSPGGVKVLNNPVLTPGSHGPQSVEDEGMGRQAVLSNSVRTVG